MGLYDREYYRDERSGFSLSADRSMVVNLILINVAVYLIDLISGNKLQEALSLKSDMFGHPLEAWQLLTAGFVHSRNAWHIVINMAVLYFFGRDVEGVYGRKEFLRIYLSLIVLSSLAWVTSRTLWDRGPGEMMGASGAVMGILTLYVLHFPRRLIYIWGVLPVPAWLLAILYVGSDLLGFLGNSQAQDGQNVAYETHLAGGEFFAFLYFQSRINLGDLLPEGGFSGWRRRPKLRVHDPRPENAGSLDQRVDTILDKVVREGMDSLSSEERQLLEDASRRYQRRRS